MSVRKHVNKRKVVEADVEALIEKGAKVKEDHIAESRKWTYINLRITLEMLNDVDECVKKRVGITRTGWILEAVYEKIQRETNNEI